MKYIKMHKKLLQTIIQEAFTTDGAKFVMINTDTWSSPLPKSLTSDKHIVLDITGWALEQSYLTDDGVQITTAFENEEYSKNFKFDDIINIISHDGQVLYQKTLAFNDTVSAKLIQKPTEPSEEYSMLKILERNSHLAKYK